MDERQENQSQESQPKKAKKTLSPLKKTLIAVGAVACAGVMFGAGWLGSYLSVSPRARELMWAVDTIEQKYYRELTEEDIYNAIFSSLTPDPYSYYMTAEEYDAVASQRGGQNEGIGISIASDSTQITSVTGNSPAYRAGLRNGMTVHAFGKEGAELTAAQNANQIVNFIAGESGNFTLRCGYLADESDAFNATLSKQEYNASYCEYRDSEGGMLFGDSEKGSKLPLTPYGADELAMTSLNGETAYVRLASFNGNCVYEMQTCLSQMKKRGRKHLVLDLRGNGGGYLHYMMQIASMMLRDTESGKSCLIAFAKYRDGKVENYTVSKSVYGNYFAEDSNVYVLADERSASASECLMGALVDYGTTPFSHIFLRDNAEQYGVARSYGKGIMQNTYLDIKGNAMRLTVAEIFWPKGKSIHGVGVTTDDGAIAVDGELYPAQTDTMLESVIATVCP